MLKFLIEACVHRRIAAVFFTLVVAAFGGHHHLPIEAEPDDDREPGQLAIA